MTPGIKKPRNIKPKGQTAIDKGYIKPKIHRDMAKSSCVTLAPEALSDTKGSFRHQRLFQALCVHRCHGFSLRCIPNGQAEPDFVHEIGNVVDQIQRVIRNSSPM